MDAGSTDWDSQLKHTIQKWHDSLIPFEIQVEGKQH